MMKLQEFISEGANMKLLFNLILTIGVLAFAVIKVFFDLCLHDEKDDAINPNAMLGPNAKVGLSPYDFYNDCFMDESPLNIYRLNHHYNEHTDVFPPNPLEI